MPKLPYADIFSDSELLRHEYKHSNSSKRISFFQKLSIAKSINLKVVSILIKVL